jgi:hypothetical protein
MTHRRQTLAVLAGFLLAAVWASGASGAPASHAAQHQVVIDSTNYQSEEQLLANTQVMVVARVESVGIDRSAPASQPASLVTLRVDDVLRGHVGRKLVVAQPRARPQAGPVVQLPLRRGHTYLLLLARAPGAGAYFLVGENAGEFAYNSASGRFTRLDASAAWEDTDFPLSLAKAGAAAFAESTQPSWLNPGGPAGPQAVSWSSMANDLGMSLTDVSCPSEALCVFAGEVAPPHPGVVVPAVAVSTGPFTPQANVIGTTTTFPPSSSSTLGPFVACAGSALCVVSSADGVSVTTDPTGAQWTLEVAPSSQYSFGQVSCPTVSFCAVATGSGVLVSESPSSGPSAWNYISIGTVGQAISCPSQQLCVAGGYGNVTVGGWIETSNSPLVPSSWHGGPTPHPSFAQHSGQYGVIGISCPSTAFCVAAVLGGEPLVSTDPAGGVGAWTEATNGSMDNPGFAACTTAGQCSVSGVGSFATRSGAAGPGIAGYPLPGVSCLSTTFCVTVTDEQLAVAAGAG